MPLSLVPLMVLRETSKPCASNDTTAVAAVLVMMLPLMSPETLLEPDAVAAAACDLAIGDADVASAEAMHEAAPCRQRDAAAIERDAGKADAAGAFALTAAMRRR